MPPTQPCCNYSLADLFNRWWVEGAPTPHTGMLVSNPYYEMMTVGNVWLPEDLLYGIALASNAEPAPATGVKGTQHVGLFGTPTGDALRAFLKAHGRPLVWTDDANLPYATTRHVPHGMLLDPHVDGIAGSRVNASDVAAWTKAWKEASAAGASEPPAQQRARFAALADAAPPYLKLTYRDYGRKDVCAAAEATPGAMVMGIDGTGKCVYWQGAHWHASGAHGPSTAAWPEAEAPTTYELLNDGTCEASASGRAKYASRAACMAASKASAWSCVRLAPPVAKGMEAVAYCVPTESKTGNYTSLNSCEAECKAAAPPAPPRIQCCFGIASCAQASAASCPVMPATLPCNASKATCLGPCAATTKTVWCPL